MCGIVGYVGTGQAAPVIVDTLRKLEYRGYDSVGIATTLGKPQNKIVYSKRVGTMGNGDGFALLEGCVGVGHTRWATHGGATITNAHPHFDCKEQIAVVHNGTIDNYRELKTQLESEGHVFRSETDTEVIPHLLENMSLADVCKLLEGTFALVVMRSGERHLDIVCRDCPLIVAKVADGFVIASDENAVSSRDVYIVPDGEIMSINLDTKLSFTHKDKLIVSVDKGNYDHFMLKEIEEQPEMLERIAEEADMKLIEQASYDISRAHQVVFTASGTSRYAALIGRYMFSRFTDRLGEVVASSEFPYFANTLRRGTVVVAISQSGETADVIFGVRKAKKQGSYVIALTNRPRSLLARLADVVIPTLCGAEIGVAASKSFTGQLATCYLLRGAMSGHMDKVREYLGFISRSIKTVIDDNTTAIQDLAHLVSIRENFYYLGRGINFAVTGEASLKLKEISYIHAEGLAAGELKHGTLALVSDKTPVCGICPNDYTYKETLLNLIEAKARGADIIGISDKRDDVFGWWIPIPEVDELYYPIVCVVPTQMLAYYTAVARGLSPDRPRNLAKSVTVR